MLRRMPDWELADPAEPRIVPSTFTRAYDRIRIGFTPGRAGPGLRQSEAG
jgi:cytochrome P450 family 142 subfamily A polypeptide 1